MQSAYVVNRRAMCMRPVAAALLICLLAASAAAGEPSADAVLDCLGAPGGIVAVAGDDAGHTAIALARARDGVTVFVQVAGAEAADAARRAALEAGLLGTRVFVSEGALGGLHLADNVADVVVARRPDATPRGELLRVLRPEGTALVGGERLTKPHPDGTDEWTHHYHGPDNNTQSQDRLARAPYLTQFIAAPRYAPAPQNVVVSGGRVFMAFGHVAWHAREEPWLNTLVAVNGFNGTLLWKRPLTSGIMVDRSTMVASPEALYLADEASCKVLDPVTGRVTGEITVPAKEAGGTFWKWMALEDGVLFALVGKQEPRDPVKRWRRTAHGWPWNAISDGFNIKDPPTWDARKWKRTEDFDPKDHLWGFSKTLFAIDPKTGKVLWRHREEQHPIDSRSLCLKNGRLCFCHFGKYLVCLDTQTGKEIWRKTPDRDPKLFESIGRYCPYEAWSTGWRTTAYLRCSDEALYFAGPQIFDVTAVSMEEGRPLWTYHAQRNPHVVIRRDGLYLVGAQGLNGDTHRLDPLTGKVLADYDIARRACVPVTGSADSLLFRSHGDGTERLDLASGTHQWISPMRPSCFVGTVIAHGHLYWTPWVCDCNLQMFGTVCCAPAGDFAFHRDADVSERLASADGAETVAPFEVSPADWPTYRADPARTAETPVAVADRVKRLWTFTPKVPLEPTAPVAAGGLVFVGGSDGAVRALDAATGRPKWTATTGGAVRYPPSVADGRALVGAGDGCAYAFEAASGRRLWRFRAAPIERRIPVYEQLLSTWPVAAGVLVHDGVAYLAAGMNNYDGTHMYAVEAATGRIRWQNHRAGGVGPAFGSQAGVQGDLLLDRGKLYLASGSSGSPTVFDAATGKRLETGPRARRGRELNLIVGKDKRGRPQRRVEAVGQPFYSIYPVYSKDVAWDRPVVKMKNAHLYCHRTDEGSTLVARDPSAQKDLWRQPLPAEPIRWGVAVDRDGRILVALKDGRLVCFGAGT